MNEASFNPNDLPTEETKPLPRKRSKAWVFLLAAFLIGGILGGVLIFKFTAEPPTVVTKTVYVPGGHTPVEALAGIHREAEHQRWMSGQYKADTKIPSDKVFAAADNGDDKAVAELDKWSTANSQVNTHNFTCTDLAMLYNKLVGNFLKEADAAEKKEFRDLDLPHSYDSNSCYEADENTPFTPGNWQWYTGHE